MSEYFPIPVIIFTVDLHYIQIHVHRKNATK